MLTHLTRIRNNRVVQQFTIARRMDTRYPVQGPHRIVLPCMIT